MSRLNRLRKLFDKELYSFPEKQSSADGRAAQGGGTEPSAHRRAGANGVSTESATEFYKPNPFYPFIL